MLCIDDSINERAKVKCHKASFSHPAFPWLGEPLWTIDCTLSDSLSGNRFAHFPS